MEPRGVSRDGKGAGGRSLGVAGSPGRVALVVAASGPVRRLGQRQALPEVLQLRLELLPFYCQLLPLGHQLLERAGSLVRSSGGNGAHTTLIFLWVLLPFAQH